MPPKGSPSGFSTSQKNCITRPSVGRQGRMVTVGRSGRNTRSLSSTFMKPAMELPSKHTPSSRALGRSLASTAMFFWVPKISQKAKRTNLTLLSSTKSSTSCWVEYRIKIPFQIKRPKACPLAEAGLQAGVRNRKRRMSDSSSAAYG